MLFMNYEARASLCLHNRNVDCVLFLHRGYGLHSIANLTKVEIPHFGMHTATPQHSTVVEEDTEERYHGTIANLTSLHN